VRRSPALTPGRASRLALTLLACCAAASTTPAAGATSAGATRRPLPASSSGDGLRGKIVEALRANHRLAVGSLWTNRLPDNAAASTRGPALAALRASAAGRTQQGVRVRLLGTSYRIVAIRLDRSQTGATAVVRSDQRLVPTGLDGQALGAPVELNERARIELRRLGSSSRFVVWRVTLQRREEHR
jgi:hypothetical protein